VTRIAVTGPQGVGKTTALGAAVAELAAAGVPCGGVLQPVVWSDGCREGYDLVPFGPDGTPAADVAAALSPGAPGRLPLARRAPGGFAFDPRGFDAATRAIAAARAACAVLVVDEVGRLEAGGGGHLPALLLPRPIDAPGGEPTWLLAVREDALPRLEPRLGRFDAVIVLPDGGAELRAVVTRLAARARPARADGKVSG